MALSQCEGCPTQFAVGLPACPHCGCVDRQEVGAPAGAPTSVAVPADDTPAPPPARRRRATTTDGDSQ